MNSSGSGADWLEAACIDGPEVTCSHDRGRLRHDVRPDVPRDVVELALADASGGTGLAERDAIRQADRRVRPRTAGLGWPAHDESR